jgi:hypothetical protein
MRNRRAATRAVGYALLVFGVGAALPIWKVWYFGAWEASAYPGALWEAVGRIPATSREAPNQFWDMQEWNLVLLVALLLVATGVGWAAYRALVRRGYSEEARDFVEGPAGSLQDGRAEPGATDQAVEG